MLGARRSRSLPVLGLVVVACFTALPIAVAAPAQTRSEQADFRARTVVAGLVHPWGMTFLPATGGSEVDLLVTERAGRLRRVIDGKLVDEPVRGAPDAFVHRQGGMLDVVLHPDFVDNRLVYLSYAGGDEDAANTEVARGRLDGNELRDLEVIFRARPKTPGGLHYGSRLLFRPDGTLLVTLGERYTEMQQAQDPTNHLGTIVRLHDDGSIPDDNPFAGGRAAEGVEGAPEVFTYGHRNVQGIALHPTTGEVWIHEHGPMGGDEINLLRPGANYGWPAITYGKDYSGAIISERTHAPGMEQPLHQWTPSIAPSGMTFYTADLFPAWQGDLFVGSLKFTHVRRLELDGTEVVGEEELLRSRRERIRDVDVGPDGRLYVLTDSPDGRVYRIEPAD